MLLLNTQRAAAAEEAQTRERALLQTTEEIRAGLTAQVDQLRGLVQAQQTEGQGLVGQLYLDGSFACVYLSECEGGL